MPKSIKLELRVWYDPKSQHIKLAGPGLTASTVSNDPASKRYHPNLYRKLARCLREAGAPGPDVVSSGDALAQDGEDADFAFEPSKLRRVARAAELD